MEPLHRKRADLKSCKCNDRPYRDINTACLTHRHLLSGIFDTDQCSNVTGPDGSLGMSQCANEVSHKVTIERNGRRETIAFLCRHCALMAFLGGKPNQFILGLPPFNEEASDFDVESIEVT